MRRKLIFHGLAPPFLKFRILIHSSRGAGIMHVKVNTAVALTRLGLAKEGGCRRRAPAD
jgi:hypothetical protein